MEKSNWPYDLNMEANDWRKGGMCQSYIFARKKDKLQTNSSIWPIDMTLSGATTLDLRAMIMNRYFAFSKAPALLESCHQIVWYHIQDTAWWGGSYPSAEMQSVYSTALADWIKLHYCAWELPQKARVA